ncbi:MAG: hypothetical protein RJB66_1666 [Pseudomonadota bacterium]|jgi:hypothetical protein
MKLILSLVIPLLMASPAFADLAYLRIVKPLTEEQCHKNTEMPAIFDFLLRVTTKYPIMWANYFHPKTIGCSPIDENPILFAHGVFMGEAKDFEKLMQNPPSFGSHKLEIYLLEELEAHYYLYADAGLETLHDVFVRRFKSMNEEESKFVKTICNGDRKMLLSGLEKSPKSESVLPIVKESHQYVLLGYDRLTGILKDGTKIPILPFDRDTYGNEWNCLSPIKW